MPLFVNLSGGEAAAQTSTPAAPTPATSTVSASQSDLLLLQAQLQNQAQQLQKAQQETFDAKNSAGAAVTLSLVATLFGIVGLVIGVLAIVRSRAKSARNGEAHEIEAG